MRLPVPPSLRVCVCVCCEGNARMCECTHVHLSVRVCVVVFVLVSGSRAGVVLSCCLVVRCHTVCEFVQSPMEDWREHGMHRGCSVTNVYMRHGSCWNWPFLFFM